MSQAELLELVRSVVALVLVVGATVFLIWLMDRLL